MRSNSRSVSKVGYSMSLEITRASEPRNGDSFSLPTHTILCIFEDDAEIGELVAQLISAAEIAPASRFLSLINQRLNVAVQLFSLLIAEDVQHRVEAIQQRQQLRLVLTLNFFTSERGVDLAGKIVNGSQRDRGVEIVVHAIFEFLKRPGGSITQSLVIPGLGLRLAQSRAKIAQAGNCSFGAGECIKRKIQLLIVPHTQQKIANPSRKVS